MKLFVKYRSTNPRKKWDVYVPSAGGQKKVSYGARGASDYTIHHDVSRRERYRARHQHDRLDDPYAPGFWSWNHLWGETSSTDKAFDQAVRRAKRLLP